MTNVDRLPIGTRVEIAPHLDLWMRGARYGYITRYRDAGECVEVLLDKVARPIKVRATDVEAITR